MALITQVGRLVLSMYVVLMILCWIDHSTQGDLSMQTPQVLPGASLMKPFSPQLLPQEFLIL